MVDNNNNKTQKDDRVSVVLVCVCAVCLTDCRFFRRPKTQTDDSRTARWHKTDLYIEFLFVLCESKILWSLQIYKGVHMMRCSVSLERKTCFLVDRQNLGFVSPSPIHLGGFHLMGSVWYVYEYSMCNLRLLVSAADDQYSLPMRTAVINII